VSEDKISVEDQEMERYSSDGFDESVTQSPANSPPKAAASAVLPASLSPNADVNPLVLSTETRAEVTKKPLDEQLSAPKTVNLGSKPNFMAKKRKF